jgi:hypothetical protein
MLEKAPVSGAFLFGQPGASPVLIEPLEMLSLCLHACLYPETGCSRVNDGLISSAGGSHFLLKKPSV